MISSNIIFLSSTLDTGRKARFTIDIMAATLLFIACWSFWNDTDDYKRPRYGRGIHTYTRVHHLTSQLSSGALSHQFSLPPCLWAAGQFSFSCIYLSLLNMCAATTQVLYCICQKLLSFVSSIRNSWRVIKVLMRLPTCCPFLSGTC